MDRQTHTHTLTLPCPSGDCSLSMLEPDYSRKSPDSPGTLNSDMSWAWWVRPTQELSQTEKLILKFKARGLRVRPESATHSLHLLIGPGFQPPSKPYSVLAES